MAFFRVSDVCHPAMSGTGCHRLGVPRLTEVKKYPISPKNTMLLTD